MSKRRKAWGRRTALALVLAFDSVSGGWAEEGASPRATASRPFSEAASAESTPASASSRAGTAPAIYVPPSRGDVRGRVGAAVRGNEQLMALAPEGVGLTTQAQPVLYWHLGTAAGAPVRLELSRDGEERPLAQLTLEPPIAPGFHRFALADVGVELQPGQVYAWRILWPKRSLKCRVPIERVAVGAALGAALRSQSGREWAAYAGGGIWYDAFDGLSQQIERAPADGELRRARASLLHQVGLELPEP